VAAILIDSNVLLDLMTEDPRWFSWSAQALAGAAETYRLVINPIIYAEVSIRYSRIEHLDAALPKAMIDREPIPYEAAFLAGKAFRVYRQRGGIKRSTLPDFFYRCSCLHCRIQLVNARCSSLSYLLSQTAPTRPGLM
jgi:predicted nucleic acid-binding protein